MTGLRAVRASGVVVKGLCAATLPVYRKAGRSRRIVFFGWSHVLERRVEEAVVDDLEPAGDEERQPQRADAMAAPLTSGEKAPATVRATLVMPAAAVRS